MSKQNKLAALKESVADTMAGLVINLPMNYALLALGLYLEMGALELTLFMTAVFTVIAIVRKYYIRLHFISREEKLPPDFKTQEQYTEAMRKYQYR